RGGIIVLPRHTRDSSGTPAGRSNVGGASCESGGSSSVLPPMDAREQLAYAAVIAALRLDDHPVGDLRRRPGVRADAMDELRQCFEIKMSSAEGFPNEVRLTQAEFQRAQTHPDFFLAIVAGLEEGAGQLRVRFVFNPLAHLSLRFRGDALLGGVRDAE